MADSGRNMPCSSKTGEGNRGKHRSSEEGALRPQFIPKGSSEKARDKQRQSAEEVEKSVGCTA
jgi:hypothetical protein